MKVLIGTLVLALAIFANGEINSIEDLSTNGYHWNVGIPQAIKIKKAEEDAAAKGSLGRIVGGSITDISEIPYQVSFC